MKKIVLIPLLVKMTFVGTSQVALSYYPFQTSQLSISTNTEKILWLDYRIETNTFFSNLNMELSPMLNVKRTTHANYYVGPGLHFNPIMIAVGLPVITGYFIDIGTRIKPFEKNRSVHFIFELSPYLNTSFSGGNLRGRLGVGYNFTTKNKNKTD